MSMIDLIQQKRRGRALEGAQLDWLVQGVVAREIPDYQLAALLMAICYERLDFDETLALTRAFVNSGSRFSWDGLAGPVVDKHSTGGVGDKVSLLLVPWLAAAGCIVPKMSGRGLGHTGGTIDKLESIPGFRTVLDYGELRNVLQACGCAIVAQSDDLVPADRLFYALRDATDTVYEPGLIAASVMSKKIAGGADFIVLDIKCGAGAFFSSPLDAAGFGDWAVRIGDSFARHVRYVVSGMDQPLGRAVGNALEVEEALEIARQRTVEHPLTENCLQLGGLLLTAAGICGEEAAARATMLELLSCGAVEERMYAWIAAQGGRLTEFEEQLRQEKQARRTAVTAGQGGLIADIDALAIGRLAHRLGAGRTRKEDPVDPFAGLELLVAVGSVVQANETLAYIYPGRDTELTATDMATCLRAAITYST